MADNVFPGIKAISLRNLHINGVNHDEEHLLQPHMDLIKGILEKLRAGERVYLGITSGERKGSIAYIHSIDEAYLNDDPSIRHMGSWNNNQIRIENDAFFCVLGWDKRRNKIQWGTGRETVYLPDYQGPTVWKKVDKKALAEQALKDDPVEDCEGNLLEVGDRVIYINARYGSGARLERGEIKEIKMSVDVRGESQYKTVHVIIDNDEGQRSDIKAPGLSVLKASSPMDLIHGPLDV